MVIDLISRGGDMLLSQVGINFDSGIFNASEVASYIKLKHAENWARLYTVYTTQYQALANVDVVSTITHSKKYGKVITHSQLSNDVVSNHSSTSGGYTTNNERVSPDISINSIKAFDSPDWTDSKKISTEGGNNKSINNSNSLTDNTTTTQLGTRDDTESGGDSYTESHSTLGNQGVTKSQEMLKDEFKAWSRLSFFNIFFDNIIEELTVPYYSTDWRG